MSVTIKTEVSTVKGARSGRPERWVTRAEIKAKISKLRRRADKSAVQEQR